MRLRILLFPLWFYLFLWGAAAAYAWYKGTYDPAHSEFAGLPLIFLGLPWSFLWHEFNPRVLGSDYNNSIIVESIFAFLNATIIFLVTMAIRALFSRSWKA